MTTANVSEDIRVKFPLHYAVWENDYRRLERDLAQVGTYGCLQYRPRLFLETALRIKPIVSYFVQTSVGHPSLLAASHWQHRLDRCLRYQGFDLSVARQSVQCYEHDNFRDPHCCCHVSRYMIVTITQDAPHPHVSE